VSVPSAVSAGVHACWQGIDEEMGSVFISLFRSVSIHGTMQSCSFDDPSGERLQAVKLQALPGAPALRLRRRESKHRGRSFQ
jgi:hypothetical protein